MSRAVSVEVGVALTLLLAALAASAPPVSATDTEELAAATDGLVVGSSHTDLGTGDEPAPQTLTNLSTSGSDDAAVVSLDGDGETIDDFEDGGITEYTGDTSNFSVSSTDPVLSGSNALHSNDGDAGATITSSQLPTPSAGDTFAGYLQADSGDGYPGMVFGYQDPDNFYAVEFGSGSNRLSIVKDGTGVPGDEIAGTDVEIAVEQWYDVEVAWKTNGTITATIYEVDQQTGVREQELASATATDTAYSSGEFGWLRASSSGAAAYDDARLLTGTPASAQYESALHAIDGAEQAAVNITKVSNVSVDIEVRTDGGTTLAQETVTSAANHSLNLSDTSSDQLETVLGVDVTGDNPQFALADESILFTNHAPSADSLTPTNGTQVTNDTVEFSADISDAEFPSAQGDSVEATLFVDGAEVGTETVTSNQTVSISHTFESGGSHEYYWTLTDSYGASFTTDTRTLESPSELRIYNESAPSQLVDNATLTIRFLFQGEEDRVVEREVSDGVTNFTDLPPDVPFVVSVRSDDYRARRIYVPSLYDTQAVYLLPDSAEHVSPTFTLSDYTGDYAESDTVLVIQRPINGSWKRVQADFFGSTGEVAAMLEFNVRHRLYLQNTETGDRRFLGKYTPLQTGEKELRVTSDSTIVVQRETAITQFNPSIRTLSGVDNTSLSIGLNPGSIDVSEWNVTVTYQNSSTNETLTVVDGTGSESVAPTLDLGNRTGGTVTATVEYAVDGTTYRAVETWNVQRSYDTEWGLVPTLVNGVSSRIPTSTHGQWTTLFSVFASAIFAIAAAERLRLSTEGVGLVALGSVSAFAIIRWAPYSIVFVGAVSWASFAALRRGL